MTFDNYFISFSITIIFCIFKFLEQKYITDDIVPLKIYIRDALIVFISSFISSSFYFNYKTYITQFFNVITESKILSPDNTPIFIDNPGF
jgi:hypothetical protein